MGSQKVPCSVWPRTRLKNGVSAALAAQHPAAAARACEDAAECLLRGAVDRRQTQLVVASSGCKRTAQGAIHGLGGMCLGCARAIVIGWNEPCTNGVQRGERSRGQRARLRDDIGGSRQDAAQIGQHEDGGPGHTGPLQNFPPRDAAATRHGFLPPNRPWSGRGQTIIRV